MNLGGFNFYNSFVSFTRDTFLLSRFGIRSFCEKREIRAKKEAWICRIFTDFCQWIQALYVYKVATHFVKDEIVCYFFFEFLRCYAKITYITNMTIIVGDITVHFLTIKLVGKMQLRTYLNDEENKACISVTFVTYPRISAIFS